MINSNNAFFEWIDRIGQQKVADGLGVSKAAVWNWRHAGMGPGPKMAKRIVEFANCELKLSDVRPDIYDD